MGKNNMLFKGEDGEWRKKLTVNGENLTLRVGQETKNETEEEPKNED